MAQPPTSGQDTKAGKVERAGDFVARQFERMLPMILAATAAFLWNINANMATLSANQEHITETLQSLTQHLSAFQTKEEAQKQYKLIRDIQHRNADSIHNNNEAVNQINMHLQKIDDQLFPPAEKKP